MAINYAAIGQKIKVFRKKRGLSQALLSEKIDISPSYLSYIETGYKGMSLETLVALANTLNVSADELLVDNLEKTILVSNHEFASLLSDCTEYERRVLLEIVRASKLALRENRSFFRNYHP